MESKLSIYSENIVKNPTFKNGQAQNPVVLEYWTKSGGVYFYQNYAVLNGLATISQDILTKGVTYKITFSVLNGSPGYIQVQAGTQYGIVSLSGRSSMVLTADSPTFSINSSSNFSGNVMNVEVVPNPGVFDIDLTDNIEAPVTFSIADVRNPDKRNSTWSKTITIPGTKSNDLVFGQAFEISGEGSFNPNKKVRCTATVDGLEVVNGFLQLLQINRINNGFTNYSAISYDVALAGHFKNIYYDLGNTELTELDFSKYDHTYDRQTQQKSWSGFGSAGTVVLNGVDTANFNYGPYKNLNSATSDADGRVLFTSTTSHNFVEGDMIFLVTNNFRYCADMRVYSVTSPTTFVTAHPFDSTFTGTALTGFCYKHEPKGAGYVYPMVQTDVNFPNQQVPNAVNVVSGKQMWNVESLFPAIYLREYLAAIFKIAGYSWKSAFLDSPLFKRLIVPFTGKNFRLTPSEQLQKSFYTRYTSDIWRTYNFVPSFSNSTYIGHHSSAGNVYYYYSIPFNDDFTGPTYYDNTGNFNNGTGQWTCNASGKYDFHTEMVYEQWGGGALNFGANDPNFMSTPYLYIRFQDFTANTFFNAPFQISVDNNKNPYIPGWTLTYDAQQLQLIKGHKYGVRLCVPSYTMTYPTQTGVSGTITFHVRSNAKFTSVPSNTNFAEGDTIPLNSVVPEKIKCTDFLSSVVRMFNLFVEVDKGNDKQLNIEPRDAFYAGGGVIDWTSKLAIDQPINIMPMGQLDAQEYRYSFTQDSDFYNEQYRKQFNRTDSYGDFFKRVDNDFVSGTNETKIIFSPTLFDETVVNIPGFANVHTGRYLSQIYQANLIAPTTANISGLDVKESDAKLRVLYYNLNSSNDTWLHGELVHGYNTYNIYPSATHVDHVQGPTFDLNWGFPYGWITMTGLKMNAWTDNNLFNTYYKDMVTEITDPNSKLVTAWFNLKPSDINKLDFRNTVIVDGNRFRLNQVKDYSLTKNGLTQVEFLKATKVPRFVAKHIIHITGIGTLNGSGSPPPYNSKGNNVPVILNNGRITVFSGGVQVDSNGNPLDPNFQFGGSNSQFTLDPRLANRICCGYDNVLDLGSHDLVNFIECGIDEPFDPAPSVLPNRVNYDDTTNYYGGTGISVYTVDRPISQFIIA